MLPTGITVNARRNEAAKREYDRERDRDKQFSFKTLQRQQAARIRS